MPLRSMPRRPLHMTGILWLIFIVLLVLWLIGFAVNWGAFINLLLIAAVVILVMNVVGMFTARSRR